jgi:hypothetical protein
MIKNKSALKIDGRVIIIKKFKNKKDEIIIIKNRIMDDALDEIIKSFYSPYNSNMLFKHIAFGDDNTANTDDMNHLVNEIYRVPILYKARSGVGSVICRAILKDTQPEDLGGICTIKEIGLFAGINSYDWLEGSGKDFGLLISRIILDPVENKIGSELIQVTWEYEIGRG